MLMLTLCGWREKLGLICTSNDLDGLLGRADTECRIIVGDASGGWGMRGRCCPAFVGWMWSTLGLHAGG